MDLSSIRLIPGSFIEEHCDFTQLIDKLKDGFLSADIQVPMRHRHEYSNPPEDKDSTLLLMPAFKPGVEAGVKLVTVNPNNGKYKLPAIQGAYIYLNAQNGSIKAIIDANSLTAKRTSCTSALAGSFLARKNASSLLMIGTGELAIDLIRAHCTVRPITKVYVWGRSEQKAQAFCDKLSNGAYHCTPVANIEDKIQEVDIISCATLSPTPLVFGRWLKAGQHLDLVGAYNKDSREADNEAILKSSVFLDTYQGGLKESGDIVIPLQEGVITKEDIKADLFELCNGSKKGRTSEKEITCFKSVGHALEDLVAASYFYHKFMEG